MFALVTLFVTCRLLGRERLREGRWRERFNTPSMLVADRGPGLFFLVGCQEGFPLCGEAGSESSGSCAYGRRRRRDFLR